MSAKNNQPAIPLRQGRGDDIPALGLGSWRLDGEECVRTVRQALEMGYSHVDTAEMYGNEAEVGRGMDDASVDRDSVFLTTKVFRDHLAADSLKAAAEESLKKLGTDYVDLLLIHWPNERVPLQETLGAMQELQEAGEVRNIGVSNFTVGLMQEAEEVAESPIFCNQVEYHPFLSQEPVLRWCREHGLLLTAYSPLARGKVLDEPVLERIGETHGKTPAQVALRWMMQQEGVVAIPKASSEDHLRQNLAITDFELSEDEMEEVSGLARGERIIDPSVFPTPEWDT